MNFQITVRYGSRRVRYHTYQVEASDVRAALNAAARDLPEEVAREADLVEVRVASDPEGRAYVGDGPGD